MYRNFGKRLLDIGLAAGALLMLWPVMLLTALAIRLFDGPPIFFYQARSGRRGQSFRIIKFRSLPVNTANVPSLQAQAVKPSGVGRIIRRINIDELPQLINVLKGEMSIVGPRPALPTQASLLSLRSEKGADVCTPGLTGLAQINSYDHMPENEKADWDGLYAQRVDLAGDLLIICKTFKYLMRRPPVY